MTFTHAWVLLFLAIPVVLVWTAIARAPAAVAIAAAYRSASHSAMQLSPTPMSSRI